MASRTFKHQHCAGIGVELEFAGPHGQCGGQSSFGLLPRARFTAQLPDEFGDLSDACCTKRMPLGQKATADVYNGRTASRRGRAGKHQLASLSPIT